MDASLTNIDSMTENELRELLRSAEDALDRLVAKRARSTLKEAKRMAAEVGFEVTFVKTGKTDGAKVKPQSLWGKVLPKYRNPENPDETWSGRVQARTGKQVTPPQRANTGLLGAVRPLAAMDLPSPASSMSSWNSSRLGGNDLPICQFRFAGGILRNQSRRIVAVCRNGRHSSEIPAS